MGGAQRVAGLLLPLVLIASCARQRPPSPAPKPHAAGDVRVQARGTVTALAVSDQMLSFCDQAGLHEVPLPGGHPPGEDGALVPCPSRGLAPRAAAPEVTVRNPEHGPDDIIEIEGVATSFPIAGRARDWAGFGTVVVIATATQVLRLDVTANRQITLSTSGAERVATDGAWAAWVASTTIVARRL